MKIAVLGAGPMGLAVAYQLVKDGYKPVVFEAGDRVGGMTASFDFGGVEIERFYHFHCVSDSAFLELLEELGLSDKMRWVETKMGYWYNGCLQPWGNPKALVRFRGLGWLAKLRYAVHAFLATKRKKWHSLDKIKATTWIRNWVGREAYDVLWRKLFELKFYHLSSDVSAAWIWSRIRRIGRSRFSLFREKLGYLEGGSPTLMGAMKNSIESAGGEIRLNSPVLQVEMDEVRVSGVKTASGIEKYDAIISTIPLPYVSRIMSGLPVDILNSYKSVKNIAVVCVIAKLKKRVSENFWLNINDPEMDVPGIVEYSNLRPMGCHIVYVPFYMPGDHPKYGDADEVFVDKVCTYLKKINTDLKDEDIVDIRASRYRFAQPVCEPGFMGFLPPIRLPVKGLFVADTSYYYPEDRGISESVELGRSLAKEVSS